jgi:DHA1 family bicyclomycin/chloramphenicol resistance-like MFS transporter
MKLNIKLVVIFIIALVSSSIVLEMPSPSFISIGKFFNANEKLIGYIISYSLIGSFFGSFIYGPLADFYGRKKILLFGNLIALIGSIGCVFAKSIEMLIFFRFVQGSGSSCSLVLIPIIVSDLCSTDEASKFYRINAAFITIFTAIAPIAGGFINDNLGWNYNFQIIMYFAVLALLCSSFIFETKKEDDVKKISLNNIASEYKFLLKDSLFLIAASVTNLLYANFLAFLTYSPFLYMKIYGLSASKYSIHQAIVVIAFSIANFALSRVSKSMNLKLIKIGLCFCLFGSFGIYFFNYANFITFFVCFTAFGAAMIFPTVFAYAIGNVAENLKGAASSFIVASRYLLCGVIIYFTSNIYNGTNSRLSLLMFSIYFLIAIMTLHLFKNEYFKEKSHEKITQR